MCCPNEEQLSYLSYACSSFKFAQFRTRIVDNGGMHKFIIFVQAVLGTK
jgi:hypothetical protein